MQILKNIQFTHNIKINDRLKEFNFRKSNGSMDSVFTVDTIDDHFNRITFTMYQNGDKWSITQATLPNWILEKESTLSFVISETMAAANKYVFVPEHNGYWHMNRLMTFFGFN